MRGGEKIISYAGVRVDDFTSCGRMKKRKAVARCCIVHHAADTKSSRILFNGFGNVRS